jgi:hypothetical protein
MQKGSKNIQERRATCVVEDAQSTVIHAHGDSHQPQPHDGGWKLDELKVERGHDPSKGSNDNENREGAKSAIIAGDALALHAGINKVVLAATAQSLFFWKCK